MKARYLNPFTDFGFKKLFGEEASKPLLMDFLNALLPLGSPSWSWAFAMPNNWAQEWRNAKRFTTFIVKIAKQNFFKDRAIFYTTFPIREQAEKGPWTFELKAVYCVGILDFVFEEDKDNPDYLHEVKLKNRHNRVFYDKYALYFIEMPKFHKAESELASQLENWIYLIKHLEEFPDVPARFQHTTLERVFEIAELAHLTEEEREAYETSLKHYRDMINVVDTARLDGKAEGFAEGLEKGFEQGRMEGKLDGIRATARQMKLDGMPIATICKYTGLTLEEIKAL